MTTNVKRILVLLAAAGVIAVVVGASTGTFASFNAEVANQGNTFVTGTLFLQDTAQGNVCNSEGSTNNSLSGCTANFNVTTANGQAGSTFWKLALADTGTLATSDIAFYRSACTPAGVAVEDGTVTINNGDGTVTVTGVTTAIRTGESIAFGTANGTKHVTTAPTAVSGTTITFAADPGAATSDHVYLFPTFTGGGSGATIDGTGFCGQVGISVWKVSGSSIAKPTDVGANADCVYGCTDASTSAPVTLNTIKSTVSSPEYLSTDGAGVTKLTLPAGGTPSYFLVEVHQPDLNNSFQSQQASLDLTWHVDDVPSS